MNEYVNCEICDFKGKQLTTHILRKHKITIKDYKEKFSNSELISEQTREKKKKNTISPFSLNYWLNKNNGIEEKAKCEFAAFINKHKNKMKEKSHFTIEYWLQKGYTKEEAKEKISENSKHNLSFFTNKYGEELGTEKYNSMCSKIGYKSSLKYLIDNNSSESEIELFKIRKATNSLENLIQKHGSKIGTEKYNENIKKLGVKKDKMISLYGKELGTEKYNNWKQSCSHDLSFFINKYGEELGTEKYNNWVLKTRNKNFQSYSTKSFLCFSQLPSNILKEAFFKDNEYKIDKYFVDFKYKNKIIEFYGDFWHMNPSIYDKNDFNSVTKLTAEETWQKDKKRIEYIEKKEYNILIIWEKEFDKDIDNTKIKMINFLKEKNDKNKY